MSPSLSRIVRRSCRTRIPEGSCPHSRPWDRPTNLTSSPRSLPRVGTSSVLSRSTRLAVPQGLVWPVECLTSLSHELSTDFAILLSAPFVAGSAALVLQARGKSKEVALAMRDLLESTASPIASNLTDKKPLQTLIWSGAGLIQVDRAVNTKTLINPGHLTLNDTAHFRPK